MDMWKDSDTNIDYLGFNYIKNTLNKLINNVELMPSSIGLYGFWGSGKSSLIRMSYEEISINKNNLCIIFNGWRFEGYEDAKFSLISMILSKLENELFEKKLKDKEKSILKEKFSSLWKKLNILKMAKSFTIAGLSSYATYNQADYLLPLIGAVSSIPINETNGDTRPNLKSITSDIEDFNKEFSELLDTSSLDRVVIYIDELDRCDANTILSVLEAIRLFLFTPKTVFVIGADERHVMNAVKTKFSDVLDAEIDLGKEYLEKMIQYPIRIPELTASSIKLYISLLLLEKHLNHKDFVSVKEIVDELHNNTDNFDMIDVIESKYRGDFKNVIDSLRISENYSDILTVNFKGNPRQIKRFLNTIEIRKNMASSNNISLNESVLFKVMLLEYFKPKKFEILVQAYVQNRLELKKDLEKIEQHVMDNLSYLDEFKDDSLIESLLGSEPRLSGYDLMKYFYYTNSQSIINKSIVANNKELDLILNHVYSNNQFQLTTAKEKMKKISETQVKELVESLYKKEKFNNKYNSNMFIILLEIISLTEDYYPMIENSLLKQLDSKKIHLSSVILIRRILEILTSENKSNFQMIIKNWIEISPKLNKILEG
jgi:predicted KAP-like P-loop ATPase